jgi:hypothetical protein
MTYIPLVTFFVSLIFAITVLDQYFARRKPYQLLWAIGLFMYAISTFTEFWWGVVGHVDLFYRLWYLTGALLVVVYLGQGTLYLLMKRGRAHLFMVVLGIFTLYATIRVFTASIRIDGLVDLTGKGIMPMDLRIMAAISSPLGALAIIGGAVYSAYVFWRKRILLHRVVANVLIALGALSPAIGDAYVGRMGGDPALRSVTQFIGAILMLVGFMRTKEVFGLYRFPLIHGFKKIAPPTTVRPPG